MVRNCCADAGRYAGRRVLSTRLSTDLGQSSTIGDKCCLGASRALGPVEDIGPIRLDARGTNGLPEGAANHVEHFFDVPVGVPVLGCRSNAALDVVLEDKQGNRVDRGA